MDKEKEWGKHWKGRARRTSLRENVNIYGEYQLNGSAGEGADPHSAHLDMYRDPWRRFQNAALRVAPSNKPPPSHSKIKRHYSGTSHLDRWKAEAEEEEEDERPEVKPEIYVPDDEELEGTVEWEYADKIRARVLERWSGTSLVFNFGHWKRVVQRAQELRRTSEERAGWLKELYMFAEWPMASLINLARRMKERAVTAGEQVALAGEQVAHIIFIRAGELKLVVPKGHRCGGGAAMHPIQLATRGAKDTVGEFVCLQKKGTGKWSYNVVAGTAGTLLLVTAKDFKEHVSKAPAVLATTHKMLTEIIPEREARLSDRLEAQLDAVNTINSMGVPWRARERRNSLPQLPASSFLPQFQVGTTDTASRNSRAISRQRRSSMPDLSSGAAMIAGTSDGKGKLEVLRGGAGSGVFKDAIAKKHHIRRTAPDAAGLMTPSRAVSGNAVRPLSLITNHYSTTKSLMSRLNKASNLSSMSRPVSTLGNVKLPRPKSVEVVQEPTSRERTPQIPMMLGGSKGKYQ